MDILISFLLGFALCFILVLWALLQSSCVPGIVYGAMKPFVGPKYAKMLGYIIYVAMWHRTIGFCANVRTAIYEAYRTIAREHVEPDFPFFVPLGDNPETEDETEDEPRDMPGDAPGHVIHEPGHEPRHEPGGESEDTSRKPVPGSVLHPGGRRAAVN